MLIKIINLDFSHLKMTSLFKEVPIVPNRIYIYIEILFIKDSVKR